MKINRIIYILFAFILLQSCSQPKTKQYFFLNCACEQYHYDTLSKYFGPQSGNELAVGNAILMYIFAFPMEENVAILKKHFVMAEQYDIPILVELDPITFWDGVPELWNWWDPNMEGYDPANKENVEWSSWSSEDAVKLGWLNWGRQIRLRPMANLFSPKYQAAVEQRMDVLLSMTKEWYDSLPRNKKYLLGGIKITGEFAFGVNNWYYEGGNDLFDKDPSEDPSTGIDMWNMPTRGVGQIGYASLKYAGIKSEGEITAEDIYELEYRYAKYIADFVQAYGFPRELLFSHSGGVMDDLASTVQSNTCPSWSFYWAEAEDPTNSDHVKKYLATSDAPYWGLSEWNIGDKPKEVWQKALETCYAIPRCRFISLFNYDTIFKKGNGGKAEVNLGAVEALNERR